MTSARLVPVRVPPSPEGVVLVVHGGASRRGEVMVNPAQLSVLRMIPVARRMARAGRGRLAVYRLLNSYRGWDTRHTPADDVAWAVRRLVEHHGPDTPICLVGHSLGRRACLVAATAPSVTCVVALAAFVYPSDAEHVVGHRRRILFVHGVLDRIAPLVRAQALAANLRHRHDVGFVGVVDGKHAMLARRRLFESTATGFVASTLLGTASPDAVREAFESTQAVLVG